MTGLWLVTKRELGAYLNTYMGYVIVALLLVFEGLLFNAFALGGSPRLSTEVLKDFFYFNWGVTCAAAILLTMRLIAEERQTGTIVLLDSSPLTDWQVVGGKYLSAMIFLTGMLVLSGYMPALVAVNGQVSVGHIMAGYLGVFLTASAVASIGTFTSSLVRSQLLAAVLGGLVLGLFILAWLLGRITEAPFDGVWSYMSLFDRHFQPFQKGRINTEDIVYYVTVTFVFLLLATRLLSARRWR